MACNKALDINPKDSEIWYIKCRAHRNLMEIGAALDAINKVLDINPRSMDAWELKGSLLQEVGLDKEAKKCLEKVKKLKMELVTEIEPEL